jgi:parallel beta-helix repeat protein
MKRLLVVTIILLVTPWAFAVSTLYVNCPGKSPDFAGIQDAVNHANPGATIIVCSGTYRENVTVLPPITGLTIEANNGAFPQLVPPNGGASSPGFSLFANTTITGFYISGFTGSAGIVVNPRYGGTTLAYNNIHNNQTGIALLESSGGNVIKYNSITWNSTDGIFDSNPGSNDTLYWNFVSFNGHAPCTPYQGQNNGIEISSTANGGVLFGNIVGFNGSDGIYLNNASDANIEFNVLTGNGCDGLYLNTSLDDSISGNTAQGNGNDGVEVNSSSKNNTITNNQMTRNSTFDAADHSGPGGGTAETNNTWTNNECSKPSSPAGLCTVE